MSRLRFHLFGNFQARLADDLVPAFSVGKLEEMLCFLLLHRQLLTGRESLAARLWSDCSTAQSKKYLRDALWKLHEKLALTAGEPPLLLASAETIQLNPQADVWVDVSDFEATFLAVEKVRGSELTQAQAQLLRQAVALYRGDLLLGWYQEWCLDERVRFQEMHLKMLHKLMLWCEANAQYEEGLHYGETLLRYDRTYEQAYRSMMRLRHFSNDRTGALQQYKRLTEALESELGVQPSRRSQELFEQIRTDQLGNPWIIAAPSVSTVPPSHSHLPKLLAQCKQLLFALRLLEQELQQEVAVIECSLQQSDAAQPEKK